MFKWLKRLLGKKDEPRTESTVTYEEFCKWDAAHKKEHVDRWHGRSPEDGDK